MKDVASKSSEELKEIRSLIDSELKKRASKERQEVRRQIIELASAHEIDLGALAGTKRKVGRYRNPENQFDTWTGKGRQPKWVKEQLAMGKSLQDLEIT